MLLLVGHNKLSIRRRVSETSIVATELDFFQKVLTKVQTFTDPVLDVSVSTLVAMFVVVVVFVGLFYIIPVLKMI